MITAHFLPADITVKVEPGTTILDAARRAGILIEAPCNGAGQCGKCAVLVPTHQLEQLVLHDPSYEIDSLTSQALACHTEVVGDVTITVPQLKENGLVVVGTGISRAVACAPYITREFVPERGETLVRGGNGVLAVEPGNTSAIHVGMIFDIGTTTLVAALIDLYTGHEIASASALNPQSLHAQDVLSRIRFASTPEGLDQLQSELLVVLNSLTDNVCAVAGIGRERVFEVIFSGNTCMLHLAAGVDPSPLGKIPFTPSITGGFHLLSEQIGLHIAPKGIVYLPHIISAYVGADISVGILAADLNRLPGVSLFIDIGTNGELALAVDGVLTASATAAGPAFEGMNISCGMRAADGAVERVSFKSGGTLEIGIIGEIEPVGICGSGLMDLVAMLIKEKIIAKSGRFDTPEGTPVELLERLEGEGAGRSFRIAPQVSLTQKDVRQVQLAKGAIRAGIELLLSRAEVSSAQLDRILIAGSFGYHLSEESLLILGLLPPDAAGKISFLGNTSRSGGELLLLNSHLRDELAEIVSQVTSVELAADPAFERVFVEAMKF
ncbi:MAG: ASKHA domain-containing protein [Desulfuromonadaceae bacterium]